MLKSQISRAHISTCMVNSILLVCEFFLDAQALLRVTFFICGIKAPRNLQCEDLVWSDLLIFQKEPEIYILCWFSYLKKKKKKRVQILLMGYQFKTLPRLIFFRPGLVDHLLQTRLRSC